MLLLAGGCRSAPADREPGSFDTPDTLLEYLCACEAEERYGDVLVALAPEDREPTVYISWYAVAFHALGSDDGASRDYRWIVQRHALREEELNRGASGTDDLRRVATEALEGVELGALFDDLVAYQVSHGPFGYAFGFLGGDGSLVIEEDVATAEIADVDFTFVKRGSAWTWRFLEFGP